MDNANLELLAITKIYAGTDHEIVAVLHRHLDKNSYSLSVFNGHDLVRYEESLDTRRIHNEYNETALALQREQRSTQQPLFDSHGNYIMSVAV